MSLHKPQFRFVLDIWLTQHQPWMPLGQRIYDIVDYVKSVIYLYMEPLMRRWRTADKEYVIEMLSERADRM
jgi:hypothetical protein